MGDYRAFVLSEDGHIRDARAFEAVSDDAAVKVARRLINRHGIELLQLDRRVAIIYPDAVVRAAS
ncbi:hypothetical protein NLM33_19065 [Bradyrhizobium sp. CCGUVB1N3]|uniref:hypothetical protein n=1 Tax=Bradyrhizobium sp. CCGUVB1N3 TaxID=2949629 RepID=UPI0020B2E8EC|nr:hypothetical protein [Bradyrhizobium sp. CCGUVB1N3]MCP3472416.1 hypothetical protein [Bradyrhizobium sp. CCGUVB1N3]